ncbi:MAG: hypothetical protein ACI8R0_001105, partial [Alteromonadales bacterium]
MRYRLNGSLSCAINDTTFGQIVRSHLNGDLIASK